MLRKENSFNRITQAAGRLTYEVSTTSWTSVIFIHQIVFSLHLNQLFVWDSSCLYFLMHSFLHQVWIRKSPQQQDLVFIANPLVCHLHEKAVSYYHPEYTQCQWKRLLWRQSKPKIQQSSSTRHLPYFTHHYTPSLSTLKIAVQRDKNKCLSKTTEHACIPYK